VSFACMPYRPCPCRRSASIARRRGTEWRCRGCIQAAAMLLPCRSRTPAHMPIDRASEPAIGTCAHVQAIARAPPTYALFGKRLGDTIKRPSILESDRVRTLGSSGGSSGSSGARQQRLRLQANLDGIERMTRHDLRDATSTSSHDILDRTCECTFSLMVMVLEHVLGLLGTSHRRASDR